jgi:hypothetical protein
LHSRVDLTKIREVVNMPSSSEAFLALIMPWF